MTSSFASSGAPAAVKSRALAGVRMGDPLISRLEFAIFHH